MQASTHQQRIFTAGLAVALVSLALWQGGVLVTLLLLALCALGQWEFTDMFRPGPEHKPLRLTGVALGAALVLAAQLGGPNAALWTFAACFWFLALRFLLRFGREQAAASFDDELVLLASLAYIPLMLQLLLILSTREIVLVILSTTFSDTAAFYAGTLWGKRKIWPKVSPKKSWAGSIGGLLGCMLGVAVYGLYLGQAPLPAWLMLGALLNLAAQLGDFFESALKRCLDVKDSGTLLPGHGGLLDRIDSLLLALPCYALLRLIQPFFP
ncbi:MAG: phosphatidate cytidylyltransferase [Proteobacteria bacterium]|nr:phosphatidate cytidylyltransferase [Pseudomonadota bacterium]MBU1595093.1 phosphatidate cytidylyltransferase [Pseudomonadota bacterium]